MAQEHQNSEPQDPRSAAHLHFQLWKVETGGPRSKLANKTSHMGELWFD